MENTRVEHPCRWGKTGKWAAALGAIALSMPLAAGAQNVTTTESLHEQDLSAQSAAKHHYASPAERAEDDLLIVKTKAAIADEGLADNYPLTVDADHGVVTLTGVLASREDVQRAVSLVAGIDGVRGVNNRLTWEKKP
jgi:hyperosmotically inducible periplasmic protein